MNVKVLADESNSYSTLIVILTLELALLLCPMSSETAGIQQTFTFGQQPQQQVPRQIQEQQIVPRCGENPYLRNIRPQSSPVQDYYQQPLQQLPQRPLHQLLTIPMSTTARVVETTSPSTTPRPQQGQDYRLPKLVTHYDVIPLNPDSNPPPPAVRTIPAPYLEPLGSADQIKIDTLQQGGSPSAMDCSRNARGISARSSTPAQIGDVIMIPSPEGQEFPYKIVAVKVYEAGHEPPTSFSHQKQSTQADEHPRVARQPSKSAQLEEDNNNQEQGDQDPQVGDPSGSAYSGASPLDENLEHRSSSMVETTSTTSPRPMVAPSVPRQDFAAFTPIQMPQAQLTCNAAFYWAPPPAMPTYPGPNQHNSQPASGTQQQDSRQSPPAYQHNPNPPIAQSRPLHQQSPGFAQPLTAPFSAIQLMRVSNSPQASGEQAKPEHSPVIKQNGYGPVRSSSIQIHRPDVKGSGIKDLNQQEGSSEPKNHQQASAETGDPGMAPQRYPKQKSSATRRYGNQEPTEAEPGPYMTSGDSTHEDLPPRENDEPDTVDTQSGEVRRAADWAYQRLGLQRGRLTAGPGLPDILEQDRRIRQGLPGRRTQVRPPSAASHPSQQAPRREPRLQQGIQQPARPPRVPPNYNVLPAHRIPAHSSPRPAPGLRPRSEVINPMASSSRSPSPIPTNSHRNDMAVRQRQPTAANFGSRSPSSRGTFAQQSAERSADDETPKMDYEGDPDQSQDQKLWDRSYKTHILAEKIAQALGAQNGYRALTRQGPQMSSNQQPPLSIQSQGEHQEQREQSQTTSNPDSNSYSSGTYTAAEDSDPLPVDSDQPAPNSGQPGNRWLSQFHSPRGWHQETDSKTPSLNPSSTRISTTRSGCLDQYPEDAVYW